MERMASLPAPRLDLRDLRLVLALSSAGSTTEAAALLHLTQPAVSRALLAAEDRLGVRLFERGARGLTPTVAGAQLIEGARGLLVGMVDLEARVRTPAEALTRLRVVCECYTAYHWLPSAMQGLRESLPGLTVTIETSHTDAPVDALAAGKVDVALLTTASVPRGALEECPLFTDEVVFVLAATHPLARKATLTRADLRAVPLLTARTPPREQQWFLGKVFGPSRPTLRVEQFPLTEAIVDVARAGLGVAILSAWIAQPHLTRGDLVARRLAQGPLERPWRLAWRREVRDAALRLRPALTATAPQIRLLPTALTVSPLPSASPADSGPRESSARKKNRSASPRRR